MHNRYRHLLMFCARGLAVIALFSLALTACGDDGDGESGAGAGTESNGTIGSSNGTASSNATSNGTTATSNGTTATSNGTTATSNGTTATSNGTTATSNGTTSTSNGTTSTSNGTTSTSNGTTGGVYSCDYVATGSFSPADTDQCNLFAQDCPNGQACFLTQEGGECFDPGAVQCGGTCEFLNDCQPGQICAGDPPQCLAMCEPGNPCPGDALCGGLNAREDIGVCIPMQPSVGCSILDQNCSDGQGCYVINGAQECASPSADAGVAGASCEFANGCQPGLVCLGTDPESLSCLVPCRIMDGASCSDGETCQPIGNGIDDAGVCVAAM